jgi:hypothetical protein
MTWLVGIYKYDSLLSPPWSSVCQTRPHGKKWHSSESIRSVTIRRHSQTCRKVLRWHSRHKSTSWCGQSVAAVSENLFDSFPISRFLPICKSQFGKDIKFNYIKTKKGLIIFVIVSQLKRQLPWIFFFLQGKARGHRDGKLSIVLERVQTVPVRGLPYITITTLSSQQRVSKEKRSKSKTPQQLECVTTRRRGEKLAVTGLKDPWFQNTSLSLAARKTHYKPCLKNPED